MPGIKLKTTRTENTENKLPYKITTEENYVRDILQLLDSVRIQKKISTAEICRKLDCSYRTYQRYLKLETVVPMEVFFTLMREVEYTYIILPYGSVLEKVSLGEVRVGEKVKRKINKNSLANLRRGK
jgi:hypothetical protein